MSHAAKFTTAALLSMLLSLGVAASAMATVARHRLCATRRCHVLLATPELTVVRARERNSNLESFVRTIACWRGRNACSWLGDEEAVPNAIEALPIAAAGEYLGYGLRVSGSDTVVSWRVVRLDVRTGRKQEFLPVPGGSNEYPFRSAGVLSVLVTPHGSLGWMSAGAVTDPTVQQVVALPAGSLVPQLVASASSIERASLAASAGHLYWSQAGAPRSIALP